MSKDLYIYTAFLSAIALTACLAPPAPLTAAISELAVLMMISVWFSAKKNSKAAELAEFPLKIIFIALCAKSGGMLPHTAALILDFVLEKRPISNI